ncbi:MAG: histidinol dehydrogenase [Verrucomicrobiota bacterium]
MKVLKYSDKAFAKSIKALDRRAIPVAKVSRAVTTMINRVKREGDQGLVDICNQFSEEKLTVDDIKLMRKPVKPPVKVRKALEESQSNIERFSRSRLPKRWNNKNLQGAEVGEIYAPIERVGIYVPGGTAPLVSTALMTIAIARVAGVKEIVVSTPAPVDPVLHYAICMAGATEIYQVGGAQAIAALAYGTQLIKPVLKVFGPGNAYVVEAKRQVFGIVGVDLIPGPSEIAVVADETANAAFIAADMLAQAEHGPGSSIFLLTPSDKLIDEVQQQIQQQVAALSRKDYLNETLDEGCFLVETKDLSEAIELVEKIAPEHLSLCCRKAEKMAKNIHNSGAIFVGDFSPVAIGDYMAGPSHTLPTGGSAKSFPGLMVEQFLKRTSVVRYDDKALKKSWKTLDALTTLEQMDAHKASVGVRIKSMSTQAKKTVK